MAGPSPTVRRRQLGMELRRLREAAGKTQKDAGDYLDVLFTSISKIENAKQKISLPQLRSLLQLYGVGSPHADYLLQLQREAGQRGWWADYGKTVPTWFADYVGMETVAAEVWTYESEFIPGLLQTPDYTEAVSKGLNHPLLDTEKIQRIGRLRADRQQRLTGDDPLVLRAIINEAALHRQVGGDEVMRSQMRHLIEAMALPSVTVQVLPYSAGAHPGMRGPFTCLRFPEEPMNTAYLELYDAALYYEPPDVDQYTVIFEQLARLSLDETGTAELIKQIERRP